VTIAKILSISTSSLRISEGKAEYL